MVIDFRYNQLADEFRFVAVQTARNRHDLAGRKRKRNLVVFDSIFLDELIFLADIDGDEAEIFVDILDFAFDVPIAFRILIGQKLCGNPGFPVIGDDAEQFVDSFLLCFDVCKVIGNRFAVSRDLIVQRCGFSFFRGKCIPCGVGCRLILADFSKGSIQFIGITGAVQIRALDSEGSADCRNMRCKTVSAAFDVIDSCIDFLGGGICL